MVEWDQRGPEVRGGGADVGDTLDQIVSDLVTTQLLVDEFGQRQVALLGHSWGSVVGVLAVQRQPDLYLAFVSTGQITSFADGQRVAHAFAVAEAERLGNEKARAALAADSGAAVRPDGGHRLVGAVRSLARRVRSAVAPSRQVPSSSMDAQLSRILVAGEASLHQSRQPFIRASLRRPVSTDLAVSCPELPVPVLMVVGRYDRLAPPEVATQYFDTLVAPRKS